MPRALPGRTCRLQPSESGRADQAGWIRGRIRVGLGSVQVGRPDPQHPTRLRRATCTGRRPARPPNTGDTSRNSDQCPATGRLTAARASGADQGRRGRRLRLGVDRRVLGLRRLLAADLARAHTSRSSSAPSVVQLAARTPTATAMTAMTLDHLSNGRFILGLGVLGPAGRRGLVRPPADKPLGPHPRVRRDHPPGDRARGAARLPRRALPAAVPRPGGAGSASRSRSSPTRCAARSRSTSAPRGPRTSPRPPRSRTAGSPLYYSPFRQEVLRGPDRPPQARASRSPPIVTFNITDDVEQALWPVEGHARLYIGGMGAKGQNYHTKLMARMGTRKRRTASRTSSSRASGTRRSPPCLTSSPTRSPGGPGPGASRRLEVAQEPGHHADDLGPHARGLRQAPDLVLG